jgi:hypothetical protein
MWSGDRLGLRASLAAILCPDASEGEGWPVLIERKPNHVFLLRLRVRLGRVFGEVKRVTSALTSFLVLAMLPLAISGG